MSTTETKPRELTDDERLRLEADEKLMQMQKKRSVEFKSLETGEDVELSIPVIREIISIPSKSGVLPTDRDCFKFMKLCHARKFNPIVGDAYLIGYDARDGTKWNMIVSHAALLKRAEASGQYDGMESGVVVIEKKTGEIIELPGDLYLEDRHTLIGAWAKVYRKDRTIVEYDRIKLSTFDTGMSRWAKDPGGMIVKVAEASVHRRAFPGETAGMYVREEFDREVLTEVTRKFEVEDIDDSEDRLKKIDPEKYQASPVQKKAEADLEKKKAAKKTKASKTKKTTEDRPENVGAIDVEAADARRAVEAAVASESTETQPDTKVADKTEAASEAEPVASAAIAADISDEISRYLQQVVDLPTIRQVRSTRDKFIENHELLSDEDRARVEVAAKEAEDKLRQEMA